MGRFGRGRSWAAARRREGTLPFGGGGVRVGPTPGGQLGRVDQLDAADQLDEGGGLGGEDGAAGGGGLVRCL